MDLVAETLRVEGTAFADPQAVESSTHRLPREAADPLLRQILLAAAACGIARAALSESLARLDPVAAARQSVQNRLADMATETEGAWLLTLKAAASHARGGAAELEAALAQAQALRAALDASASASAIAGAAGLAEGSQTTRLLHAARRCEVAAGPCDEPRRLLARALLQR